MKKKTILIIVISLIAALIGVAAILVITTNTIEISTESILLEYEENMTLPNVYGKVKSVRSKHNGEEVLLELVSEVDYKKIGTQNLIYRGEFGSTKVEKEIKLTIEDTTAPVITLSGDENVIVIEGKSFVEPGYAALDTHDGDLTDKVIVTIGEKEVLYEVTDEAGNKAEARRTITIKVEEKKTSTKTTEKPTFYITLKGSEAVTIKLGGTYEEAGYMAYDKKDGDITSSVVVESNIDETKTGEYEVKYSVINSDGKLYETIRKVYIYKKQANVSSLHPTEKVIYLTFDDGPGKYTGKLLDILDKYNVKATFFVTGNRSSYVNMIGEEARRGHTVGVHTYSHNYKTIYASEEAYFKDFDKINAVILAQTGSKATIFRFPGGSSNTVSKFNPGIMTRLAKLATEKGYLYTDWNVTSGDAGSTTERSKVVYYVKKGVIKRNGKAAIVLQHDIKGYSVEAVDEIVAWGLVNGYTFLPMTESSPMSHQSIAN